MAPAEQKKTIASQLEMNNLDEYVAMAQLSNKQYETQLERVVIHQLDQTNQKVEGNKGNTLFLENIMKNSSAALKDVKPLQIPRRPRYFKGQTKEEFQAAEKESYLNWRRAIAKDEEEKMGLKITPFEKNIEIWRQLWLVVEKSDLLVQIVDARNPLFYRCEDVEKYAKEVGFDKETLLLVNKADLVSPKIRQHWAEYFKDNNIDFLFFSAVEEQKKADEDAQEEPGVFSEIDVLNRADLIEAIKKKGKGKYEAGSLNVGFVGFPNVGKSSVINVLMTCKKVGVASMPGKTKHYQSLYLPEDKSLLLLDCPGLVFPSFKVSRAEMVCNGIIPIDNLSEYLPSVGVIIQCVPSENLEILYGISLPEVYSATQFLSAVARKRSLFTGSGNPDTAKTAKAILKDLVNGKLLMCQIRPDFNLEKHGDVKPYEVFDCVDYSEFEEKKEIFKQIPEDYDEGEIKVEFEEDTPAIEETQEEDEVEELALKIDKPTKRQLKFAYKRGEIALEEMEKCASQAEAETLLLKATTLKGKSTVKGFN